jgi:hypothetical protein
MYHWRKYSFLADTDFQAGQLKYLFTSVRYKTPRKPSEFITIVSWRPQLIHPHLYRSFMQTRSLELKAIFGCQELMVS